MSRIILLDSGPLGLVTNPKESQEATDCKDWLRRIRLSGDKVLVPEIVDYELRRELLRGVKLRGIRNLDIIKASAGYVPITTEAMLQAAVFWAAARQLGLPTADKLALDADVILAAQAATLDVAAWEMPNAQVIIATSNVGHLSRFVDAQEWANIQAIPPEEQAE